MVELGTLSGGESEYCNGLLRLEVLAGWLHVLAGSYVEVLPLAGSEAVSAPW